MLLILYISISLFSTNPNSYSNADQLVELEDRYVDFKLINKSAKSIPLIIPGVMKPNLSPFSSSGVRLKMGQKIFFKEKSKRYILLEVDGTYMDQKVNVSELIRKRKKELGL